MESALRALSGSGAIGAILAIAFGLLAGTIGVLGWALKRLVDSALRQQEKFADFMEALTKSLNAISINCQACRSDSVASIRDLEKAVLEKVDHTVWASHDKAKLEHDAAIDHAVEKLEESFTGAANSIRASNQGLVAAVENQRLKERAESLQEQVEELSRPHNITDGVVR